MSRQEIIDFCDLFDACDDDREWFFDRCDSLADAWAKAPHDYLIWIATRPGVLTDRELRLFVCWCVRQVWHLLTDERNRQAVEVAERHAIGEATDEELAAAWAAAGADAWADVRAAVWAAVWVASWAAQDAYLREHCKPDFARAMTAAKEVAS